MAILKCKMCGGDLNITADEKIIECEYCGSTQTVPDGSDEKKTNLFNRANRLRMDNEFDKAAGVYESIVAEFPEDAEGYWGLVLCSYGIEYVDDTKTGKKIPTCHRTITSSVMDDDNFIQACENADVIARSVYREEAKAIDKLQQKIIAVVENEEPYDVFICYKETDDITKQRTEDSLIAQDIYTELIKEGYKVFFSRVTLRDKAGTEYEPYIYAALKSAKIMLAIGTKFDYYDAVWVKNEWGRFLLMMAEDSSKHLIPCFKNLDAYDVPKEFKNLQALDMGEVTFFKNLTDSVERFIPKQSAEQPKVVEVQSDSNNATIDSLLKRAFMFLEDGNWKSAEEYCEKVLDIDPECAEAYLGKLMAELHIKKQEELKNCEQPFDNRNNYQKVIRFGDETLKNELERSIEVINKSNEDKEKEKNRWIQALREKQESYCVKNRQSYIFEGYSHTVGLKSDGTVVAAGENDKGQCNVSAWKDIVAISAGSDHTIGLKSDGTVVAVGDNDKGQCNVSAWKDIVAISAGSSHTVGLKSDGTVVAVGDNYDGRCNVSTWKDIVAISVNGIRTVGLKSDGTVVAVGENDKGQCNVSTWKDIVAISASYTHTVGLKLDGTVVAVGDNYEGRCNVSTWKDIVAIFASYTLTVGLKSDGTVVAVGDNDKGQCNVSAWKDIVAISVNGIRTVGLKSDGTVVAVGENDKGQCNVSTWKDIVAISADGLYTIGLKSDGTVVGAGRNDKGRCNVSAWKDIVQPIEADTLDEFYEKKKKLMREQTLLTEQKRKLKEEQGRLERKRQAKEERARKEQERLEKEKQEQAEREEKARLEEEKRKEEQQKSQYRNVGACQHCGGEFKGLFTKTCTKCGKKKDY